MKPIPPQKAKANAQALLAYWKMGQALTEYGDVQGSSWARKAATHFQTTESNIYAALRIGKIFTRSRIERLGEEIIKAGAAFSVTHLNLIARLSKDNLREALLIKAVQQRWSRRELETEIAQILPGHYLRRCGGNRGARPRVPSNVVGMLHELRKVCNSVKRRGDAAEPWLTESSFADKFRAMVDRACEAAELAQEILEQIRDTLETTGD